MMLLRIVWDVLAPIFLVAGTGFVEVRRLHLEAPTLSATAFYIFTPCLVFTSLLHIQLDLSAVGQIVTLNFCMAAILVTF